MVYTGSVVTVAAATTRVPLASSRTAACWVSIQAPTTNTLNVYVGDKTVAAANGQAVAPGGAFFYPPVSDINMYNLAEIYVDADTNGNAVRVLYGRH